MKRIQAIIPAMVLMFALTGCGDIAEKVSASIDDHAVKAQSEAVIEQSKAVVEESKAVIEQSKAVDERSGAVIERSRSEEDVEGSGEDLLSESETAADDDLPVSHPLMILDYHGEKFDIANMTMGRYVLFMQKMSFFNDTINLNYELEPYYRRNGSIEFPEFNHIGYYNPYDKETYVKDAKLLGMTIYNRGDEDEVPEDLYFFNGKLNKRSSLEEYVAAIKEEGLDPEVSSYDHCDGIEADLVLNDGRKANLKVTIWDDKGFDIQFYTDPYYE